MDYTPLSNPADETIDWYVSYPFTYTPELPINFVTSLGALATDVGVWCFQRSGLSQHAL